jgi:hypothetical protein
MSVKQAELESSVAALSAKVSELQRTVQRLVEALPYESVVHAMSPQLSSSTNSSAELQVVEQSDVPGASGAVWCGRRLLILSNPISIARLCTEVYSIHNSHQLLLTASISNVLFDLFRS